VPCAPVHCLVVTCNTKKSPDTCRMAGNNCWLRSTSR